jgi:hypothetical protein
MAASSPDAPFPDDVEARLAKFTGLMATAIANAESREELTRLANEQAALRRMATLVARGAPPVEVFETVIAEVARLIPADSAALSRYEADGTGTTIGTWSSRDGYGHVGTRHPVPRGTLAELILETRQAGRITSYAQTPGSLADIARDWAGAPRWGADRRRGPPLGRMGVAPTTDEPLAIETEARLAQFTDLVATAISNSQTRGPSQSRRGAGGIAAGGNAGGAAGAASGGVRSGERRDRSSDRRRLRRCRAYETDGTLSARRLGEKRRAGPVGSDSRSRRTPWVP